MELGFRSCKRCRPDQLRWPAEELVHKTKEYIDAYYSESLTLGGIAKAVHTNQYHLNHIFKQITGMTPVEYLRDKRLTEAKQLLQATDQTVIEVAVSVGFISAAHFSTAFRKQFGFSPTTFRRRI